MQASNDLGALAEALAKAQSRISGAKADSQNKHLRNKYASLSACWDACRVPLADNQLSVVQGLTCDGQILTCTSRSYA